MVRLMNGLCRMCHVWSRIGLGGDNLTQHQHHTVSGGLEAGNSIFMGDIF